MRTLRVVPYIAPKIPARSGERGRSIELPWVPVANRLWSVAVAENGKLAHRRERGNGWWASRTVLSFVALIALVLASTSRAQVGSVGPVADTGGPVHEPGGPTVRGGPVAESGLPAGFAPRLPLGGSSVRDGSRGVYGDGPVRSGSAGSVAEASAEYTVQVWPAPQLPEPPASLLPPQQPLLSTVQSIAPLPRDSEAELEPATNAARSDSGEEE